MSGLAMVAAGERRRWRRWLAAPLLIGAIAVLHFCGMAAMMLRADPAMRLPPFSITPAAITPIVAGVCLGLLALATVGMRLDMAARARLRWERERLSELAGVALEGLLICEGDIVVAANASVERLSCRPAGGLLGCRLRALLPALDVAALAGARRARD